MRQIKEKKQYRLYKSFLKKFRPYYNVFFLSDLIRWIRDPLFSNALFLNAEQIKKEWGKHIQLIKNKKASDVLNFYIHIPFCRSKCSYCMYYSKPVIEKELENYINKLIKQMIFFKKTFSGIEFSSLYIGGGTPSILSAEQLKKVFDNLFGAFNFRKDGEKTFESNPESITLEKLTLLKKFGFNRISFGVQTFDKKVLSSSNRNYQNYELVKNVIKNAEKLGFEVNADLMIGLYGDSVKTIINSFIILTKLEPDSITLYPLKPPEKYLRKYFNNDYHSFRLNLQKKADKVRRALKSMENALGYYIVKRGFEIYTSVEPVFYSKKFKAPYNRHYDATSPLNYPKPTSLFGLGTGATSYIFNSLQHHDATFNKEGLNFNPKEKIFWSMRFNLKDEMRYFIFQQLASKLCFFQKEFKEFFKADFKNNFKEAIDSLRKLNKIKFDGDRVFLPSNPLERFTCCLFFFDEKKVIKKINDFFSR